MQDALNRPVGCLSHDLACEDEGARRTVIKTFARDRGASHTEMLYGALEHGDALSKLCRGNELSRAVCDANIARAEHDRLRAESLHLRRFRAKADRARALSRQLFEQHYEL